MKKKKKTFLEECEEFEAWREAQLLKEWQLNQENADEPEQDKRLLIY